MHLCRSLHPVPSRTILIKYRGGRGKELCALLVGCTVVGTWSLWTTTAIKVASGPMSSFKSKTKRTNNSNNNKKGRRHQDKDKSKAQASSIYFTLNGPEHVESCFECLLRAI